jgi:hypothetical protein
MLSVKGGHVIMSKTLRINIVVDAAAAGPLIHDLLPQVISMDFEQIIDVPFTKNAPQKTRRAKRIFTERHVKYDKYGHLNATQVVLDALSKAGQDGLTRQETVAHYQRTGRMPSGAGPCLTRLVQQGKIMKRSSDNKFVIVGDRA